MQTPVVDFNALVLEQLPPNKRTPYWEQWMKALVSQIVRLYGILYSFVYGNISAYYDAGTSYGFDNEVLYNYQIYKSLVNNNIGNTPDMSPNSWQLVLRNFIGISERARYCCRTINLEWALNRYFKYQLSTNGYVGFVQPDDPVTPTNSSIYITTFVNPFPSFLIGDDELGSDQIGNDFSTGWITDDEIFTTQSSYLFIVHIPVTVYASINADPVIAEKIVRRFLDKYVISGIYYNIETY